jgi:ATP-dependent Lon protease
MQLLRLPHPLAFSASVAFEQSYGGIDGDSASGAEMVCLLSALTAIPVRQGMAMTGAIDQHGHIEAIGGVNEKIEGFFDACRHRGLTGQQGVVIPKANAADLMLRRDVVQACRENRFSVYAVSTIQQAIELMTGTVAGEYAAHGFPPGSLLAIAVERAGEFWRRTLSSPDRLTSVSRESSDSGPELSKSPDLPGQATEGRADPG